ncbi:MAG: hypothetical protein APF84_05465 [Gracilibacter sp. BRH_c7a]|nr:MAG: hypothetical protein APF84_05465 [Gracilibacter sp. BRH_c7a]
MAKELYKVFKALGEPTRLKIIKMLSVQGLCVCELSETLDMLQPRVSQHLKILKEAGLISEKKEGYWVHYSLDKKKMDDVWNGFKDFLSADLRELEGYGEEYERMEGLAENEQVNKIKEKIKVERD